MKLSEFRAAMGLPPLVTKTRECLRCRNSFESKSFNNRVCYPCKKIIDKDTTAIPQNTNTIINSLIDYRSNSNDRPQQRATTAELTGNLSFKS